METCNNQMNFCQKIGYKGQYIHHLSWRFQKTNYILQNLEGDIIYNYNGEIIKNSQDFKEHESMQNLDVLQHLRWEGLQFNKRKIGEWKAIWKHEGINAGGFFNEDGSKIGLWIELFKNYWHKFPIRLEGEYLNDNKFGRWKIQVKNDILRGNFDENGLKYGKWIELDDLFYNKCDLMYCGIYHKGKKIGLWNTKSQKKIIGGGVYDSNGLKNGFWIELHENYFYSCLINLSGNYSNGKQLGKWEIKHRFNTQQEEQIIGGGIFQDNGLKEGLWTEPDENFSNISEIIHYGNYIKGKRNANWKIIMGLNNESFEIGGGFYNQNGLKHGKWIELDENYLLLDPITCSGNYHNGLRIGEWQTFFLSKLIGLGSFNLQGIKTGLWIQTRINFYKSNQVIEIGNYEEGLKVGLWQTRSSVDEIIIGTGQYNKNGLKDGYWIELDEFNYYNSFNVYQGCYINGKKIGVWKTFFRAKKENFVYQKIGGGNYDKNGVKYGKWIEWIEQFSYNCYVLFSGEYKNGRKYGQWDTFFKQYDEKQQELLKLIGGGRYNENGRKQGRWFDLHQEFWTGRREISKGEYQNGIRQGSFIQQKI